MLVFRTAGLREFSHIFAKHNNSMSKNEDNHLKGEKAIPIVAGNHTLHCW